MHKQKQTTYLADGQTDDEERQPKRQRDVGDEVDEICADKLQQYL
jgi:hypothetical protein